MFSFVAHSRAAWFLKQCQGGMSWARQSWGHRAVPKQMAQQTLGQLWAPRVEDSALYKRGRKTRNNSSVPSTGGVLPLTLGKHSGLNQGSAHPAGNRDTRGTVTPPLWHQPRPWWVQGFRVCLEQSSSLPQEGFISSPHWSCLLKHKHPSNGNKTSWNPACHVPRNRLHISCHQESWWSHKTQPSLSQGFPENRGMVLSRGCTNYKDLGFKNHPMGWDMFHEPRLLQAHPNWRHQPSFNLWLIPLAPEDPKSPHPGLGEKRRHSFPLKTPTLQHQTGKGEIKQ